MVSTGDRSAKVRTYNYPQGRLTEHRIGLTICNLPGVLNGDLQEIMEALQFAENAEKLKEGTCCGVKGKSLVERRNSLASPIC